MNAQFLNSQFHNHIRRPPASSPLMTSISANSSNTAVKALTGGRLLAINTIWSLGSQVLPMLVAVLTIPLLIQQIGKDRFGVLSLAWIVIGYFGMFDLGTGKALTKIVADLLAAGEEHTLPSVVWGAVLVITLFGCVGSIVMIALSHHLVSSVLNIPLALQYEARQIFFTLALSLPLITSTSGLKGILEARQYFGVLSAIRIPLSIWNYGGPLLVFHYTHSLSIVVILLVCARFLGWIAHLLVCLQAFPQLRAHFTIHWGALLPILRLGSWLTVSNILGPLMVYLDRFTIGTLLTLASVTYYSAPSDIVTRLAIIPTAIAGVLFPAFAVSYVADKDRILLLVERATKYIFLSLFPIVFAIVLFAPEGLTLWLGADFATHSVFLLRLLAIGNLINGLAIVPFTLIQGIGRPKITAILHMCELPAYLLLLKWSIGAYGLNGVAVAWTLRVIADAILVFFIAKRLSDASAARILKPLLYVIIAFLTLVPALLLTALFYKLLAFAVLLILLGWAAWKMELDNNERHFALLPLRYIYSSVRGK